MAVVGVSVCVHEQDPSGELLQVVRPLYAEIYAEPPYLEGPDEVADFAAGWTGCCQQPGFRLVVADADGEPVGFSFGHRLGPETDWWDGLLDPVPAQVTQEWERRTFAVIELAVRARHRRRGIGRILHQALLAGRDEQRVTLLSRPEAAAAQAAYASWGYRPLGRLRPGPETPVYLAMLGDLPGQASSDSGDACGISGT